MTESNLLGMIGNRWGMCLKMVFVIADWKPERHVHGRKVGCVTGDCTGVTEKDLLGMISNGWGMCSKTVLVISDRNVEHIESRPAYG